MTRRPSAKMRGAKRAKEKRETSSLIFSFLLLRTSYMRLLDIFVDWPRRRRNLEVVESHGKLIPRRPRVAALGARRWRLAGFCRAMGGWERACRAVLLPWRASSRAPSAITTAARKKHSNHQPPRRSIGRAGLVVPIGRVARSFRKRFLLFWSLLSYKRIYSNRCGQATQPTGPNITGRSGAKASSTPGREALDALLANAIERHRITISSHRAGAGDDDDDESNDGIESPKGCSGLRRVDFTQRPHSYCPCR